jgi:DUF1680 family protein
MQRLELFNCSCCPPNVLRFVSSLGDYLYSTEGATLYVHQFMDSEASINGTIVTQKTSYPSDGAVTIRTEGGNNISSIAVRIPGWCRSFQADQAYVMKNGYAYFAADCVNVRFDMPVTLYEANPRVQNNAGAVCVTRGPIVYCLEGVDNGKQLRSILLDRNVSFEITNGEAFGVPTLKTKAWKRVWSQGLYRILSDELEEVDLRFIPYFGFANRGISEMLVWVNIR